jgi:hypothetical protein
MDERTLNLELMNISATLTLARCVLSSSPEKIEPDDADRLVDKLFNEYINRAKNKLYNLSPSQIA